MQRGWECVMEVVWERLVDTPLEHVRQAVKPLSRHAQAPHSIEDVEALVARRWSDLESLCRILAPDQGGGGSGRASPGGVRGGGANRSAHARLGSAVEPQESRKRKREDESEDDDDGMSVEERAEEERRVELMLVYAVRALLELGYSIRGTGGGGGAGGGVLNYLKRLVEKDELCGFRNTRGSRYSMATSLITELEANK